MDNPAWNSLTTAHASFAEGNGFAKRYPADVAQIAATRDQIAESYQSLAQLLGPSGTTALAFAGESNVPAGWSAIRVLPNAQMVLASPVSPRVKHTFKDLNISHINETACADPVEQARPLPQTHT